MSDYESLERRELEDGQAAIQLVIEILTEEYDCGSNVSNQDAIESVIGILRARVSQIEDSYSQMEYLATVQEYHSPYDN